MHLKMHLAHAPENAPQNAPEKGRNCTVQGAGNGDATVRMTVAKVRLRRNPPGERPPKRLEALVRDFAARVRRECGEELKRDPKAFRAAVLLLVRRALPLRRGRPNNPRIDAAVRMQDEGKTIKEILQLQTRNFDKVDTYGRYLAEKGLRTAVTRRRKRNRNTHQK